MDLYDYRNGCVASHPLQVAEAHRHLDGPAKMKSHRTPKNNSFTKARVIQKQNSKTNKQSRNNIIIHNNPPEPLQTRSTDKTTTLTLLF